MKEAHCHNCEKTTGHKRALGVGAIVLIIITGGIWLLALPFYPKRCIVCGVRNESDEVHPVHVLVGVLTAIIIFLFYSFSR